MQRVVILGGNYAGLRVARDLATDTDNQAVEIMLVSQTAEHLEIPSLYEVATAYLKNESVLSSETVCQGVGFELVDILAGWPVQLHIGHVKQIDTHSRLLLFDDHRSLSYDYLVLSVGAALATYDIPGVDAYTFSIKTLDEALRLRHHIIRQFRMAAELNPIDRQGALTFVVVGAGAAGVEMAAELAGLMKRLCQQCGLDPTLPRLYLVEADTEILREIPSRLRHKAEERLRQLGVTLLLSKTVESVEMTAVLFGGGHRVATKTVVWTAGLRPHDLLMRSGLPLHGWGVAVQPTLQVVGHPEIFAAGDCAVIADSPVRIPATVPVAYTQGALVARTIRHRLRKEPLEPYRYHRLGQIITLGGKNALVVLPSGRGLVGFSGWIVKRLLSLRYWLGYLPAVTALALWWRGVMIQTRND